MATRLIETKSDIGALAHFLGSRKLPVTVTIESGKLRSYEQNRLQRLWVLEAEAQGDQTAEEYRGYCKLHFGVPILRSENDKFREAYDKHIRHLDYKTKLAMMMVPLDFPVTRLMTTKQKTRYLDVVYQHFTGLGMRLTEPSNG
ncbi:MAG: hypothetical protein KGJ13_13310 [Patescibacteria group bacterium]|nr:hypothetical protein [Patescibacteria group bacterium]